MLPVLPAALVALAFLLLGIALSLLPWMAREKRILLRLRGLWQDGEEEAWPAARPGALPRRLAARLGRVLLPRLSHRTAETWQAALVGANFRGTEALAVFAGMKALLLAGLPLLAWIGWQAVAWEGAPLLVLALAGAGGLLLPDAALRRWRLRRVRAVERGLPDALDMLVICAEAGLGLEAAIERLAREIAPAHPALAEEFALTGSELRIGSDRRAALLALGARLDSEPLKRLCATLIQTMQFGTPLAQSLRLLAAEMRQEQLTQFEARAARLPVLLTLPLILFILPTVFLVLAGPAVLQVLRSFR